MRARRTADIVEIGRELVAVKQRVAHGRYTDFVTKRLGWSERSGPRFVEVFEMFKTANLAALDDLTIDASSLYLIAAPAVPETATADAVTEAETGKRITKAEAQRRRSHQIFWGRRTTGVTNFSWREGRRGPPRRRQRGLEAILPGRCDASTSSVSMRYRHRGALDTIEV